MKKLLCLLPVALFVLACGNTSPTDKKNSDTTISTPETPMDNSQNRMDTTTANSMSNDPLRKSNKPDTLK